MKGPLSTVKEELFIAEKIFVMCSMYTQMQAAIGIRNKKRLIDRSHVDICNIFIYSSS